MNFYVDAWKKFATFDGRSRRKEFWIFWLVNALISGVLQQLARPLGMVGMIILGAFGLAILLPMMAGKPRHCEEQSDEAVQERKLREVTQVI